MTDEKPTPSEIPAPEPAPTDAKASCLYPNSSRGVAEMLKRGFNNGVVLDPLG